MKKVLISILAIFFIVCTVTTVYAATGTISLSASASSVVKGKTFTVTVAGAAENNITALQGKLSYDTTKLEIQSKQAGSNFTDASGANEIAVLSQNAQNLSKSATLYTITFKVLDNAAEGETTITVSDAVLALVDENAAQVETDKTSGSVTITIKADSTTIDNGTTEETGKTDSDTSGKTDTTGKTNTSTNGGSKTSGTTSGSSSKGTTKKTTKLPQTGVEMTTVIAIAALGAIAVGSFVAYKKYKEI